MKLAQLNNKDLTAALDKLSQSPVPVKVAFKLREIMKNVAKELETFEDTRKSLIMKYADRDEAGNIVLIPGTSQASVSSENVNQFASDMKDLLNLEVNVGSISINDLGDSLTISTRELLILDEIVSD